MKNLPLIVMFSLLIVGAATGHIVWSVAGVVFGFVAAAVYFTIVYRRLGRRDRARRRIARSGMEPDAWEILAGNYVRGAIDRDTFDRAAADLCMGEPNSYAQADYAPSEDGEPLWEPKP